MPRCACAELNALRCVVCLLISRYKRQYVRYLRGGGAWGPREDNQLKKKQTDEYTKHVYSLVSVSYLVLQLLL